MSTAQYGNPSATEVAGIAVSLLALPAILAWTLLMSPFVPHNRAKSWRRVLADRAFHHITGTLNVKQLQYLSGTTRSVYEVWAKKNGLPVVVEELGEDARLLWIGEKRTDRVMLYFHGGAFVAPMQDFAASFWQHIQAELCNQNIEVGVAILNYSLVPTAHFPTQLKQAALAFLYLTQTLNVPPHRIQIVGDSIGGNLAFQLISHILHPIPGVPRITLNPPSSSASSPTQTKIRGIYAMSPWMSLASTTHSMVENSASDCIGQAAHNYWGDLILSGVPAPLAVYRNAAAFVEPVRAPDAWFAGADEIVDRVLVTAGAAECMRDDIIRFVHGTLERHLGDRVELVVQRDGVHDDPYLDFLTGEGQAGRVGELTGLVREWIARGFEDDEGVGEKWGMNSKASDCSPCSLIRRRNI